MRRIVLALVGVCVLVLIAGCGGGGDDLAPSAHPSVWINASWSGGRTGSPLSTETDIPDFSASYCPPNSLILENHSARYQNVFSNSRQALVFANMCTQPISLLVCVTSGSGGNFSEFPMCNVNPRTTPLSRLASVSMGAYGTGIQSTTWRTTGANLDLNIFYCGVGETFTLGVIAGSNPTDCF